MKIDELIEYLEKQINTYETDWNDDMELTEVILTSFKISLSTLKAHKAGYKMFTYDYSERDLVEAECELSKLLEVL